MYVETVRHLQKHKHASVLAISQLRPSSISDCSKTRHACSRRCRSSSMSWKLQRRHIYFRSKI